MDSAALQTALNTPLYSLLSFSARPAEHFTVPTATNNTQPIAWKTFTKIILPGLCWAVINLKVRCHIVSTEPQKSKDKRKQPQDNPASFFKRKHWKNIYHLQSSFFILTCSFHGAVCEQRKDNSATVRDWEPGLHFKQGQERNFLSWLLRLRFAWNYYKLQTPLTFLFSVCLLLLFCSLALGFVRKLTAPSGQEKY